MAIFCKYNGIKVMGINLPPKSPSAISNASATGQTLVIQKAVQPTTASIRAKIIPHKNKDTINSMN